MSVSVIVPVYNEQENIRPLAAELAALTDRLPGLEILFVDDGSTDGTWQTIRECRAEFPAVRGLRCLRNRGQSSAMLLGLREATGDVLVTIDGDGQNNPADIPRLVEKTAEFDVVCGYRANRKDTRARRMGSRFANWARNRITHDRIRDTGCSLKAFHSKCVADLPPVRGVHRFMPAYFLLNGRTVTQMAVDHRPRTRGTSKYTNLQRLPRATLDLIGFAWYRKRYLPPFRPEEVEADGVQPGHQPPQP